MMVDAPPALVGDKLLARDRTGEWLAAEVVSERGEANEREVFVAFSGWCPGHNEWIGVSAGKLANLCYEALVHRLDAQVAGYNLQGFHAEEDCWDALCVVDKRGSAGSVRSTRCAGLRRTPRRTIRGSRPGTSARTSSRRTRRNIARPAASSRRRRRRRRRRASQLWRVHWLGPWHL